MEPNIHNMSMLKNRCQKPAWTKPYVNNLDPAVHNVIRTQ